MKTLYLLRHGKAANEDAALPDIRRPLTEQGFHEARLVSEALRKQGLIPEIIISSDAVRAYTTAFIFLAAFEKISGDIMLEHALYESTVTDYLNVISKIREDFSSCMIVGHNNTISMVVSKLLGKNHEGLSTSGVVVLSSTAGSWNEFDIHPCKLMSDFSPGNLN